MGEGVSQGWGNRLVVCYAKEHILHSSTLKGGVWKELVPRVFSGCNEKIDLGWNQSGEGTGEPQVETVPQIQERDSKYLNLEKKYKDEFKKYLEGKGAGYFHKHEHITKK